MSPEDHIRNLILVKLLRKSHSLLHAAAVADNGDATLLCGPPNIGKSRTSFTLASEYQYRFMADDMLIIAPGKALSNIPLVGLTPSLAKHYQTTLGFGNGIKLHANAFIESVGFKSHLGAVFGFHPVIYVDLRDLLRERSIDVQDTASVKRIYFLERGDDKITRLSPQESYRRLIAMNRAELPYHSDNVLLAYSFLNEEFRISDVMEKEASILKEVAERAESAIIRSSGPERYAKLISASS
jgi:hypothetical protein